MARYDSPVRRADDVVQKLRTTINALDAAGQDKLPPERSLAEEFGVSRRVVRQALSELEAEGQIARVRGRGTIIIRQSVVVAHHPSQIPPDTLDLKRYTSPVELMEARLVLEPAIAALAAAHASSRDLDDMRQFLDKSRAAQDHTVWDRWDGAFHKTIGRSTYNGLLIHFAELLNAARAQTAWGRLRKASLTSQRQQQYTQQHEAILAAIAARDVGEATRAMREHLLTVKRTLIDRLSGDEITPL